jgi:predicted Zn-dependent peptidase
MSINRKIQPKIKNIEKLNYLLPEVTHLNNNTPLYKINTGTQEVLRIEFIFRAGIYFQSKKLIASLTNKMLSLGTKSYSAFEIAEQIDTYGAYLDTSVDKDYASVSLYCLNKHLKKLLPVFQEVINEPRFSEKEFNILLDKTKQEHSINLEKVKYLARVNFYQLLYGKNHPYGMVLDFNDFDKIDISDIKNFYQEHYTQSNSKIIISGKTPSNIKELMNQYFNTEETELINSHSNFNIDSSIENKHKITKIGALQSALRIGKPIVKRKHPDYVKLNVLNTVLGGYFGSRLMSNIREDKGYTYGIGSSIISFQHSGYFSITTEVGDQYKDAALEEIYKELHILRTELIPHSELELVKNYITGQVIRSLDGAFALGDRLKMLINYELPHNYFQNFATEIRETNSQTLLELANKHLAEDSLIELVVGS